METPNSKIVLPDLPPHSQLPLVSIVVPTYNREELLCNTLRSLFTQTYPHLEIIVVDQTEEHEEFTRQFLEQNGYRLHIIHSRPPGVARARSAGALAAHGDIVLYVDDDVVCDPGLVVGHVRAHQISGVGVVGGRITEDRDIEVDDDRVCRLYPDGTVTRFVTSRKRQFVDHAPGANMSFKRDLLLRAGLFEPLMGRTARFEETDACIRVVRLGYKVVFEPTARVHHLGGPGGQSYGVGFEGWYRTVVHNGLLLVWRNMRYRYWPLALLYRFRNAFYLTRRDHHLLPLRIFFEEAPRSLLSYFRSQNTLPKGAPRWPVKGMTNT
ncbi:MAG: glycosyltransferase family 2 protein [Chloroflexi bacterium]|nr:glycosyltransferase family 2 protein [Chloroflexota bacterium]